MTMTMKQVMVRNLIVAFAMVLAMPAFAGEILSYRGGALAIGCDGADGMFSSDSQGLGCKIGGYTYTREQLRDVAECKSHDDCNEHQKQIIAALPETWAYWQPIGEASGSVALAGNVLYVQGQICTETECIGLGDRMVIMSSNGQTADVIMDGGKRATITLLFKDSGVVQIGTGTYLIHTSGLQ